jgi:hypothetical protein
MRSSMMIKKASESVETYVIGVEATRIVSELRGISDVCVENQYMDRVTLSFQWDGGLSNFDSRPNFDAIDVNLQARGMHRMQ